MKWSTVGSSTRAAALAATLALAGGGGAQAIIYTGSWDPLFGDSLPYLSFSGTTSVYVPDVCFSRNGGGGSGFVNNQNVTGNCTASPFGAPDPMRLVSASVTLTDTRANGGSETIDFLAGLSQAQLISLVQGVYIEFPADLTLDGRLLGLQTGYIGPRTGTIPASKTLDQFSNDFYLQFGPLPGTPESDNAADYQVAYLSATASGSSETGIQSEPANVTFAVPEPGSLALVFGALGAAWLGLRRRSH